MVYFFQSSIHHPVVCGGRELAFTEDLLDARQLLCRISVWLCHFLAVCPWASHFSSMNLNFLAG